MTSFTDADLLKSYREHIDLLGSMSALALKDGGADLSDAILDAVETIARAVALEYGLDVEDVLEDVEDL